MIKNMTALKVDIWSDIRCPFCYIGKRKFEEGLSQFEYKDKVEVVWHSFQLDPNIRKQPGKDSYTHLAEIKGQSREWAIQAISQVSKIAGENGLNFNFNHAIIANSFDAHRLIQLAKKYQQADQAEELLFKAYFIEGKDISDHEVLLAIGSAIGIEAEEIHQVLSTDAYSSEVHKDEAIAQSIGIRGVPFFVFNEKYALSGAQPASSFLQVLQTSWQEYKKQNQLTAVSFNDGESCSIEGNC